MARKTTQKKGKNKNKSKVATYRNVPIVQAVTLHPPKPKIKTVNGVTTISNHERLILSQTSTSTVQDKAVQPGLFPWAGNISKCYERYCVKKLILHYVPLVGTNTDGWFKCVWDPDPVDIHTNSDMNSFGVDRFSMYGQVGIRQQLVIPSKYLNRWLFTRYTDVPNTDIKTYDLGRIWYKDSVAASVSNIIAEYEIAFMEPQSIYETPNGASVRSTTVGVSGNDYSFDYDSMTLDPTIDEKSLVEVEQPTAQEVVDGADPLFPVFRFTQDFIGVLELLADSTTPGSSTIAFNNNATSVQSALPNATGATYSTISKHLHASKGDFVQPVVTNAAAAITSLIMNVASGNVYAT